MVGLVLVSHSATLAAGLVELIGQLAPDVTVVTAAGTDDGRIGTTEDMAGTAIYLASRAGDYVVGTTLAVDGGVVYGSAGAEIAG